ncbi:pimeloyl-ACP methyl esterase BioG family protein [Campylobacter sp. 19-13652]|uniref:pimeloyl-ACP methyl esterase BioG family protein n=1 Tax=Campylobacter sp. 19-13652 TaxID=2840180 RepID=UPI001C78B213|nr:pimeloyl-ACP methyl esterase BioG family protein [Campylobacter sp. 19-13652]BCX79848.1 hypothetical protein LBC_13100 [Campylobacter sp. 19-13652]
MHFKTISAKTINCDEVVLFFAGFAGEWEHFKSLEPSDKFDVIIIYDYEKIGFNEELKQAFKHYKKAHIIAFSMGVAVASRLEFGEFFSSYELRLCIAGTPLGIDRIFGIHPRIFARSIESFDKNDFKISIGANDLILSRDNYKSELKSLQDFCQKPVINEQWVSAVGADDDSMFSLNSLKNSFGERVKIIKSKHFVFGNFSSWDELCKM